MKYTGPKVRLSRRVGVALTPRASRVMEKKPHTPGQPPRGRRRGKVSDYSRQLLEKQRLRFSYNVHERQMRTYYQRASRRGGNTIDNLIHELESRLDALVMRSGLARTIYAARQTVSHGHIQVNGKPVNIPSYQVRPNDVISVREKSKKIPGFREALSTAKAPPYLSVDVNEMSATLMKLPDRAEVPVVCDMSQVIAFYSR